MTQIPTANSYAISLNSNPRWEEILVGEAVRLGLQKLGKEVRFLVSPGSKAQTQLEKLSKQDVIDTDIAPSQLMLSFKNTDSRNVDKVQWQKDDQNVSVYITMTSGSLSQKDIIFKQLGTSFEVLVLPKIVELNAIGEIAKKADKIIRKAKLFSIGSELNLGDEYDYSSANNENISTLAEQVMLTLPKEAMTIQVAQLLLSGVMTETRNLQINPKNTDTFLNIKKLIELGADLAKVKDQVAVFKTNTF